MVRQAHHERGKLTMNRLSSPPSPEKGYWQHSGVAPKELTLIGHYDESADINRLCNPQT
jgi:hypothetical protein